MKITPFSFFSIVLFIILLKKGTKNGKLHLSNMARISINSLFGGIWLKNSIPQKWLKYLEKVYFFFAFRIPLHLIQLQNETKDYIFLGKVCGQIKEKIWCHQKNIFFFKIKKFWNSLNVAYLIAITKVHCFLIKYLLWLGHKDPTVWPSKIVPQCDLAKMPHAISQKPLTFQVSWWHRQLQGMRKSIGKTSSK